MAGGVTMDFVVVSGVFILFMVGLVLVVQGIIRKEIYPPEGMPFVGWKLGPRAIEHPPEDIRFGSS